MTCITCVHYALKKCINIIWNVSVVRQVTASDLYRKLSTLGNRMTSNASIMAIVLSGGKIVKLTAIMSYVVTTENWH